MNDDEYNKAKARTEVLLQELVDDDSVPEHESTQEVFQRLTGEDVGVGAMIIALNNTNFGRDKGEVEASVIFAWLGRRQALKELAQGAKSE